MLYNAYSQKLPGKSRKDNVSYLNIMVLGSAGSGKTAFVRTFCETLKNDIIPGSYRESIGKVLHQPLKSTRELYTVSMHVEEDNGQRTALTFIDTPGFTPGPTVDQQIRYIAKYIDYQFERTLAEESKVKRDAKALDTHIHTCLYFIDITSINGLSETDKYILRRLSPRANIIPVIGKADTLTTAQREKLKNVFRTEVFDNLRLSVYGFIEVDDEDEPMTADESATTAYRKKILNMLNECVEEDDDEDAKAMIDYLDSMPFTLIAYEEDSQTGRPVEILAKDEGEDTDMSDKEKPRTILGRSYPWATIECSNPTHCDFEALKDALLFRHKDMLKIDTFERFYEQYRTEQLLHRKVKGALPANKNGRERIPLA